MSVYPLAKTFSNGFYLISQFLEKHRYVGNLWWWYLTLLNFFKNLFLIIFDNTIAQLNFAIPINLVAIFY
jgi:hypothetical protein